MLLHLTDGISCQKLRGKTELIENQKTGQEFAEDAESELFLQAFNGKKATLEGKLSHRRGRDSKTRVNKGNQLWSMMRSHLRLIRSELAKLLTKNGDFSENS